MMVFKPLYDKIVLKLHDKQQLKSKSGLQYTQNMSLHGNTVNKGIVIAKGDGRLLANGEIVPLKVQLGDQVIFSKMQGESFDNGEDNYIIISESNILSIIQEEDLNENN